MKRAKATSSAPSGLRGHTGYWLDRLRGEVHAGFERGLAETGVSVAQWCVLIALYKGDAATPLELAGFIDIDAGAVTRLIDRLVAKGLVERIADPADRRSVRVELTEAGRRVTPKLAGIADRNDAAFFEPLTRAEHRTFKLLLAKLLDAQGIAVSPDWRDR